VFNSPSGDLGSTTHTYIFDGQNLLASGFNGGDLYGKNSGTDEKGLGLVNDPSGDHEIWHKTTGAQDFIQLDLLNLINAGFTNFMFQMGSTTGTEQWQVTACSTAGVSGSGPCAANGSTLTGTDESVHSVPVNLSATNHYLDFSSNDGNLLLGSISTPEPGAGVLLLGGIGLLGLVMRKRIPQGLQQSA
jgi:PEP-CTERM motif